jgi:hypothetical protein
VSDNDTERPSENEIRASFQKLLNEHGHAFQHAVIRRIEELDNGRDSCWKWLATEFPVEVQGDTTHIDFILKYLQRLDSHGFLVAECKRINPSFSDWCFATAPYVMRGISPELLFEGVKRDSTDLCAGVQGFPPRQNIYHIPMELKTRGRKGETTGGRSAIEEAAKQVMRGLNGLINCLSDNPEILPTVSPGYFDYPTFFVPVIFTTARLWVTDADIGAAELTTGEVDLTNAKVEPKEWLWFQSHVSSMLKHSVKQEITTENPPHVRPVRNDFATLLRREYARTIAIVNVDGINKFLEREILSF